MHNKIGLPEDEQRLRDEEEQILREEAEKEYPETKSGIMKGTLFYTRRQLIKAYVEQGLREYDKSKSASEANEPFEGVFLMDEDLLEENIHHSPTI